MLKSLKIHIQVQNKPAASLSFVHSKHRVGVVNLLHHFPVLNHIFLVLVLTIQDFYSACTFCITSSLSLQFSVIFTSYFISGMFGVSSTSLWETIY